VHDGDYVGFWSYAHRDNDLDRGRVARLANDIADEFELQTGQTLKIFIDRHSIEWGDEWKASINEALSSAVFLIPLVTPSYLHSPECRREFLDFVSHLRPDKPGHILLPILYSDVSGAADAGDNGRILRIVRKTQYEDWRVLRLSGRDSAEYRRAIHRMVMRIIDILRT
jgi:TIR domain-containing protein